MKWKSRVKQRRKGDEYRRHKLHCEIMWHSRFAWRPTHIPEGRYEDIVVPAHWVWLERYEFKREEFGSRWFFRPYGGVVSLRKLIRTT
jgi:hypothetical protein